MYRVEWLEEATNQLADAWLRADPELRKAITAASHILDEQLRT
jgi:hypothetical protein